MEIKLLYDYYSFGYNYGLLLGGKSGAKIGDIIDDLNAYAKFLADNKLQVTVKALGHQLISFYEELVKKDKNETISDADSSKLIEILRSADKTLDSEMSLREAYILTEKRFSLKNLLGKVENLFADGVFVQIPEIGKFDFYEAGKCIAFERPTAAAFHLLRAIEATLRIYYQKLVKRNRIANATRGEMTALLRKKKLSSKSLLDSLDYIRVNFRNPTAHPEVKYVLSEAEDLFGLCIESTNRLVKEIAK